MVRLLHGADDAPVAVRAWRSAGWRRAHLHHILLAGAAVLSLGAAVALVLRLTRPALPAWTGPLSAIGVLSLGVLAGALLRAVYNAARAPRAGRQLGVITDLACFWPREAHPIVPPCYAMKVAPELAARTVEHLREPGTRVVLTGDIAREPAGRGRGGAAAELAGRAGAAADRAGDRRARSCGGRTAGRSPRCCRCRRWARSRASWARGGGRCAGARTRWAARSRRGASRCAARTCWASASARTARRGRCPRRRGRRRARWCWGWTTGCPTPRRARHPGRRWAPGVQRHANYTADPEWDRAIAMAAGLDPTERAGPAAPLRRPENAVDDPGGRDWRVLLPGGASGTGKTGSATRWPGGTRCRSSRWTTWSWPCGG